jgi:hypothetical protein
VYIFVIAPNQVKAVLGLAKVVTSDCEMAKKTPKKIGTRQQEGRLKIALRAINCLDKERHFVLNVVILIRSPAPSFK